MEEFIVKILRIENVTHDVKSFRVEKPEGYSFVPGQATEVSVNLPQFRDEKRPFTFTCLTSAPYLEFTIKIYSQRKGITNEIGKLKAGDELIIRDVWGDIAFKGEGVFIAAGAGITPFLSILRDLADKNEVSGNMLLYANKTRADIILESELRCLLGKTFVNILSDEKAEGYYHGFMDENFLKMNLPVFYKKFYVCGPPPMMESVLKSLKKLGVSQNSIIMDQF